jgi:hypothetical protein
MECHFNNTCYIYILVIYVTWGYYSAQLISGNERMLFRVLQVLCCYEVEVYQDNKVQIIEGDLVRLNIPVDDRFATEKKRILICSFWVKHGNRYVLKCQCGILHGLWRTKNTDSLAAAILHPIPPYQKDSHRELRNYPPGSCTPPVPY